MPVAWPTPRSGLLVELGVMPEAKERKGMTDQVTGGVSHRGTAYGVLAELGLP